MSEQRHTASLNLHTRFTPLFSRIAPVIIIIGLLVVNTTAIAWADELPSAPLTNMPLTNLETTFLVHFVPESTIEERTAFLTRLGVEVVSWLPQIHVAEVRPTVVSFDRQGALATTAVVAQAWDRLHGAMGANSVLLAVEENVVVEGADLVDSPNLPNDPALASEERSYGLTVTHAAEGWEYTQGDRQIVVAVVDTGLNLNHPEFSGRIVQGYDFINNDDEPMDDNGHGTHTSGIIGAGMNNGIGSAGVCSQCRIMPVKALNQNNAGTWSSVAKSILFATDNGARIINLSLGAAVSSQTLEDAVRYALAHDVVLVAAAGNMGAQRDFYPAALEGVIAVSATDAQDRHWSLSNFGEYVDVAAPGYAIFSTYHDLNNYYGGYNYMSGTSMAAPFVSGLAGLLLSQDTDRGSADIYKLITSTADKMTTDVDDLHFGHGRINIARALAVGADTQWTQVIEGEHTGGLGAENNLLLTNHLFLPFIAR